MHSNPSLPATGFLRLPQIVGKPADPDRGTAAIPALIPVSRSTWWAGVKAGRFPRPVTIGQRCTVWRAEDIRRLIEQGTAGQGAH